jgi:PAS domain S-box-containing protein
MVKKPTYEELEQRVQELEQAEFDRKKTEEELRESDKQYQTIGETVPYGVWLTDATGYCTYVSKSFLELVDMTMEQVQEFGWLHLLPPEDVEPTKEHWLHCVETGEYFEREHRFRAKDGNYRNVLAIGRPIKNDTGKIVKWVGLNLDITERKCAEEALKKKTHDLGERVKNLDCLYGISKIIETPDISLDEIIQDEVDLIPLAWQYPEITCSRILLNGKEYKTKKFKEANWKQSSDIFVHDKRVGVLEVYYLEEKPEIDEGPFLKEERVLADVIAERLGHTIDRIQAEEALRESEEKYRSLVESTEDSIYLVDRNCAYLFMNKKHLSRFGRPVDKVVGREYGDFHSAEETKEFTKRVKEVFETGKSISYEYRSERDRGYFLRTLSPVKKPDGKITNVTVISKNITNRRQAEEDMKSSEVRFRELFNNMSSGVGVYEARDDGNDFIIKDYNRSGELTSKVNRENIVGRSVLEVFPGIKKFGLFEVFQRAWKTGEPEYHPVSLYQDDYLSHWAENYVYKLPSGEIVAVFDDVTERKQAEEALRQKNEALSRAHKQRKILSKRLIDLLEKDRRQIAMELHDNIGQTLTSLKMDIEMIHGKLKPEQRELGARITEVQEKAIQAIKDVKNISRGLRPGILDALGLVPCLRELFNEIQRQTDIEIRFFSRGVPERFAPEKEVAIYRIAQEALTNIIRNAKAKSVFVNLVKKGENLSLSVEDDGVGFDQDKVMTFSKNRGPLGILIMRERAEQVDGEFTLESQPGKGTHVLVEIPL